MARTSKVASIAASGSAAPPRMRRTGGSWTEEEDQRLSRLVEVCGERAWVKVAEGFNNVRDKKQCRERWCNHVNPNINGAPFSADENIFIIDFYIRNGRQWARMSRSNELQGRPDNAIKNHFNTNLLTHYIELCKDLNLPRRMSDNIEPVDEDVYALIKGKVTAPPSVGIRGVKASRFLAAFSCKIENLVNTSPKTISERRRRATTLQDISTAANRLHVPEGPPTSTSLLQFDTQSTIWRNPSMLPGNPREGQSQWLQAQSRMRLSPFAEAMDFSESDYSAPSPSTQGGRLSNAYSPYSSSERSLADVEERTSSVVAPALHLHLQPPINPWCDASGFYSLPPLNRTLTPPTPSTLFSTLSFQSNVDEEQKALVHKKSNTRCREAARDCDFITTTRLPVRSMLFSTL